MKTYYVDVRFEVNQCDSQDDAIQDVQNSLNWSHFNQDFLQTGRIIATEEKEELSAKGPKRHV